MLNRVLFIFSVICGMFLVFAKAKVLVTTTGKDTIAKIIKELPPPVAPAEEKNQIAVAFDQDRGHIHKRKKILKHIYPLVVAALFAKLIVVPLILKLLIATTSSAFVMSKIALVTSAVLALSWLLGATKEKAKLQIVQYPASSSKKFYGGWNVKEKYSPQYATSYNDWSYDGYGSESNEKSFFL